MAKPRRAKPAPPVLGPEHGPTFGEVIEARGLLAKTSEMTRELIARSNAAAVEDGKVHLYVVSCFDCDAPKVCCSLLTSAYLYEVVPLVARLRREGRDTPELRRALAQAAHRMETTRKADYQTPCVFQGADERCTVYEDRPSICGTHLVSSPASHCSDPAVDRIVKLVSPLQSTVPRQVDEDFRDETSLRAIGASYSGALPRMVLLGLEAWDRRDYITFLAERVLPAAHRFDWAVT